MDRSLLTRPLRVHALTLCAFLASTSASSGQTFSASSDRAADGRMREHIGNMRIPFVSNAGQTDPAVAYYASTFAGTVYVTKKGEIVYSLPTSTGDGGWSLTEAPVRGRVCVTAEQRAVTQVSHFSGNDPERWRSGIATYETVGLGEVWPGVRLSLRAHGDNVEKIFTVEPGADPSRIRMRVAGARSLRVDEAGSLVTRTGLGDVTFTRPTAYQERDGVRRAVTVAYRTKGRQYGFEVRGHDPSLPIVIDPLLQATYLGGGDGDGARALAIHPTTGEVFVAGETISTDFPGTAGGAQPVMGGGYDAFVARLNATLTTLIQATYLGGSEGEIAIDIAIHPTSGEVFVAGTTASTDFPGTAGGVQPANGGFHDPNDGFIARLNSTLTTLNQATYLGGQSFDSLHALAIHPTTGDVYVAGETDSHNFPPPGDIGTPDAFVAHLNAALTQFLPESFNGVTRFGGTGQESAHKLAIHPTTGDVFAAGVTNSTDFPFTTGGAQPSLAGAQDAFVVYLTPDLSLVQATYLGGSSPCCDMASALAIHPISGEVYVAGSTGATDFPGTIGGAQPGPLGGGDAFVARLNAALTSLNQATYLGGTSFDEALSILPITDEVLVAGRTGSDDFPGTAGGAQPTHGGSRDAFATRLNAPLTELNQTTYLGGDGDEWGFALAIHPTSGEVYVAGYTFSPDFPGTTGGAQPALNGVSDAYVARLTADLAGRLAISPASGPASGGIAVTIYGSLFRAGATVTIGGEAATGVTFFDFTRIAAITPPLTPGTFNDVVVTNPNGSICTLADGFFAEFLDVPQGDPFYDSVETIFRHGITAGCGSGNYCRDASVRRDQMAVFLLKAEHGSSYAPPACTGVFLDVPCPGPFADWVEQLSSEGITGGCGGGNYCPTSPVTREQMAVFLLKTEHGSAYAPPACAGIFGDVACPSVFADWVEQLYAEQVTGGCATNPLLYCPANTVTRGQMAVFLVKTFGLQ